MTQGETVACFKRSDERQKEMFVQPLGRRRGNDYDEAARNGLAYYIGTNRIRNIHISLLQSTESVIESFRQHPHSLHTTFRGNLGYSGYIDVSISHSLRKDMRMLRVSRSCRYENWIWRATQSSNPTP